MQKEDFLPLMRIAALGARVCYSSQTLNEILDDDRVNGNGVLKYLENIHKMGHFSVFSHNFSYVNSNTSMPNNMFKSEWIDNNIIGLSARHYFENNEFNLNEQDVQKMFSIDSFAQEQNGTIDVNLIHLNRNYKGWAVIHIDGVTRITSHQIVRYTSLNFSQRSQRYCSEKDNFYKTPNLDYLSDERKHEAIHLIQDACTNSVNIYKKLTELGIKKEDARYILPNSMNTSFLMSGTLENINHFISQRKEKFAQKEIRDLANCVEKVLNC